MTTIWYDELDSTNSEAVRRLDSLDNMSVIAALCQSKGRGKDTRKWLSSPGENLTFTIVLRYDIPEEECPGTGKTEENTARTGRAYGNLPPFPASCQMMLSAAAAASVVTFLAGKGVSAWVKWPNDVYVDKSKICGILIEHRMKGNYLKESIIGIGININQTTFPEELVNPVSVASLTGKRLDLKPSLEEFCNIFSDKLHSVYRELPHLKDVISGAFATEDGTARDENVRSCFSKCVNVLL